MKWRFLLALLPAILGLALIFALRWALPSVPILVIRIDLGLLALFTGILASVMLVFFVFSYWRNEVHRKSAVATERRARVEAQRRFLRRLDHELKNPLTGIRAALANLEDSTISGTSPAVLPEIQRQVERLARLTADLRKLADLEEIPLERDRVNAGMLLEEVVNTLRAHPAGAGRDLRLVIPRVPWPLPEVMGDYDLLSLAFFNLIDNALKFSGRQDVVEVRAAEHSHTVQVEIADSGPGIPAEDLPRIFEELFRGTNARGREGSGLGLALVRRVIERHEGSIAVHSRRDGVQGTVFTVTLPIASSAVEITKR